VAWICRQGQSDQAIKVFQITCTPYVNKKKFYLPVLTQVFRPWLWKCEELSNNSFHWKNVIFYGVKTYSDPSYNNNHRHRHRHHRQQQLRGSAALL